ncbi:hypothetical protein G6F46_003470 [Rhizopus delemar]|nr:hypothetical protein G6F43_007798 [Rhizopus delemar]KAG1542363.1 hypothetical protein G6F51_007318 [Rhizopus arrhizus]KAG1458555.1 hypothetical protein G6F55_005273 [Rhizopus delemar]KAG1499230.1 hypothetical protein G6F54_004545 [Rhizopus delemar]KAG1508831.1 hypothetical protein G6F53_007893 [Rhizopus delemar]
MSQFSIIRESPGREQKMTQSIKKQKSSELRFKIEPIGIQPEDDDDLDTCPSRTRPNWPRQINPWWKPADRREKPPYSYATLIAHAILCSKDGRLTLSDIYKWISEAYPFYQRSNKGWQNSIRHNLSLNKQWFTKLDRRPTQAHPGKGGYWTLQPMTEKQFVDNITQAGGHSRRHHDIGTFTSLCGPSRSGMGPDDDQPDCPNIHITRPEDYEIKKTKTTVSAPRMRSMGSSQEVQAVKAPKTDPKSFVLRFNSSELNTNQKRLKKSTKRAMEEMSEPETIKKRKSVEEEGWSEKKDVVPNEILQDFWMHEPDQSQELLLTTEYNPFCFDPEAQSILEGLQAPAPHVISSHPDMKTIDLQLDSFEKNIHYPQSFSLDPSFMDDLTNYSMDQYIDFDILDDKLPSDLLKDTNESFTTIMNSYWPDETNPLF